MFEIEKAYEYENGFYLTGKPERIGKLLAHYELYRKILDLPGAVVECGVFKGASLIRFATFRMLLEADCSRKIFAFDTFGAFPKTDYPDDKPYREKFVSAAGDESFSVETLQSFLSEKGVGKNIEFVKGDLLKKLPEFLETNPHIRISLLHIDVDLYEPSKAVLEHLVPRVVRGGVIVFDDYGIFPGATRAIDDYFKCTIKKFPFAHTPSYYIKE